jgi:hypothetical protein
MVTLKTFVEYAGTLTNKWVRVALVGGSHDVQGLLLEAQADYLEIGTGKARVVYRIAQVVSLGEISPPPGPAPG